MFKGIELYFRRGLTTIRYKDEIYDARTDTIYYEAYDEVTGKPRIASINELCNMILDDETLRPIFPLLERAEFVEGFI